MVNQSKRHFIMDLIRFFNTLFIVLACGKVETDDRLKNHQRCLYFSVDPNFDTDIVVGAPWHVYHTWNIIVDKICLTMSFKNATPMVVHRIWADMNEYLETDPYWHAATLVMSMGSALKEVLLLANQGPSGSFLGVPNVVRYGNITPLRKSVPLLMFQMKLIENDQYLVIVDCNSGVGTLSARDHRNVNRTHINTVAQSLKLGDGFPSCVI